MNLPLENNESVVGLYVLNEVVAVRLQIQTGSGNSIQTTHQFKFYEKPLVAGNFGLEIDVAANVAINGDGLAYSMARDPESRTADALVDLYVVDQLLFQRYQFAYNMETRMINVTPTSESISSMDGTLVRMETAFDAVIISCADCSQPSVNIYHRNMQLSQSFDYPKQESDPYNLAIHEQPEVRRL